MYRFQKLRSSEHLSRLPATVVNTCFDKNTIWVHHNAFGSDFISVVLIKMFPGALSRLICHDFTRFVLLKTLRGVNSYSSSAKLDSLEMISGATFRIIGLTKIPKVEFLPLDWIYRSI